MSLNHWLSRVIFACSATFAGGVSAEGRLVARLENVTSPTNHTLIVLRLSLSNEGDEAVSIYRAETPIGREDGSIGKPVFEILDSEGRPATFIGVRENWGALEPAHFTVIHPGESFSGDIDVTRMYDFGHGGAFAVRYRANLGHRPDSRISSAETAASIPFGVQKELVSNEVIVYLDRVAPLASTRTSYEDCGTTQQNDIDLAYRKLHDDVARPAYAFLSSVYKLTPDENGKLSYVYVKKQRYERWFGVVSRTEPVKHAPGWYESDNFFATRAVESVYGRTTDSARARFKPKCGCPGRPSETKATVEDHNPYLVVFCPAYFALPDAGGPWPTKISVLAHEMSHFYDDQGDGTADYGYGQRCAEDLAAGDRWTAARNADNVEFFITDTRPYGDIAWKFFGGDRMPRLPSSCLQ